MGNISKIHILAGHIGSGKSAIAERLRANGYLVIDTDFLRKDIYLHDSAVRTAVISKYGMSALNESGLSNEIRMKALMDNFVYWWLEDRTKNILKTDLINILVNEDECTYASKPYVFIETPNVFNWVIEALCVFPRDKLGRVFVVHCDRETRTARVIQRLKDKHLIDHTSNLTEVNEMIRLTDELQSRLDAQQFYSMDNVFLENPDGADLDVLTDRIIGQLA